MLQHSSMSARYPGRPCSSFGSRAVDPCQLAALVGDFGRRLDRVLSATAGLEMPLVPQGLVRSGGRSFSTHSEATGAAAMWLARDACRLLNSLRHPHWADERLPRVLERTASQANATPLI